MVVALDAPRSAARAVSPGSGVLVVLFGIGWGLGQTT
jgi:hypothetical protein